MLIWRGAGAAVIVIAIAAFVMSEIVTESIFKDESYYQTHGWPKLLACWIAAILSWYLGQYLNQKQGRILIDKNTGEEVFLKPHHSLFFIKVEYWGPVFFILGFILLFVTTDGK
jgi:hypothetical protein